MYILAIGWLYVALMASLAQAGSLNGSILGAVMTFLGYGLLPVGLLLYILGRPARRRREQQATAAAPDQPSETPDAGRHAPTAAEPGGVAPVRKED